MLLHNLTLNDFGAYRGTHTLELATQPSRPIILIGGLNGCGKTTLLDAIQLVLYGARARCSGRGTRPYETYLRESINRRASPSKGASIALEFSITVEGEERMFDVHRSWKASGKSLNEFVSVFVDGKLDPVAGQNWADYVEDLLPLEVASLFFFDGERIESLADPDRAAAVIESAVHSLLGVNTIEQLRSDLLGLQRRHKLSNEDQKVLDRIGKLQADIEEAGQHAAKAAQERAATQSQLDAAMKELADADHAFEKDGGDLFRRQGALEEERKTVSAQLAEATDALRHDVAAGPLPLRLLREQLAAVLEQANHEHTAAEAAQVVAVLDERDQWLVDLLPTTLSQRSRDSIIKRLAEDRAQREAAAGLERILDLPAPAMDQIKQLEDVLAQEQERARRLLEETRAHSRRLEAIDRMLASVPDEDAIAQRLERRDRALRNVALLDARVAAAADQFGTSLRREESLKADLERAHRGRVQSLEKVENSARLIAYSDKTRSTLEKFADAVLKRHISRLEVAVLDSFNRLMRKNGLVHDLQIDIDKFRLTLIDGEGNDLDPGRLSAGERQLLAISLLWGLARVAGNWLPTVIDTPLGRLDSKHREHLVDRYFPQASHQVLLLSTDEEIDERLLKRLKPRIAHTYMLVHDDDSFTTSVKPGYWWAGGSAHVA